MAYPPHQGEWVYSSLKMGVFILSDALGKPFSVPPAADDYLLYLMNNENLTQLNTQIKTQIS